MEYCTVQYAIHGLILVNCRNFDCTLKFLGPDEYKVLRTPATTLKSNFNRQKFEEALPSDKSVVY